MKRTLGAVLAGLALAVIVACGGAKRAAVSPAVASGAGMPAPGGVHDPRIVEADAKIDADMKQLGLTRPASVAVTCAQPPCGAMTLGVKPTADPKCVQGTTQTCTDNCKLADSICENADTICKIAKELANDSWANEKCVGAETSCETARGKCCGCA